jgi:putative restriction endonuclease
LIHEIGCILLTSPIFFPEEMWIQGPNDWSFNLPSGKYYDTTVHAYQQCAVTKEHSIPALEAAHIKPYSMGGFHEINNGLLLRADIHKLECTPQK